MKENPARLRVVTYNIHKCVGLDRLRRPERVIKVLKEIDADIIGLQEVVSIPGKKIEADQVRYIAAALGMEYRMRITRTYRGGVCGNMLLSSFPFLSARSFGLSRPGRKERACLHVDLGVTKNLILHVYNAHFGISFRQRKYQALNMMKELMLNLERQNGTRILLGDFNDWTRKLPTRLFSAHFSGEDIMQKLRTKSTYPGIMPFMHLDHIYYDKELVLEKVKLHRSRTALIASDHLPLVADFIMHPAHRGSEDKSIA